MKEQAPTITKRERTPGDNADTYDHPAYGTIQLSRMQGHARLFDSQFEHQHYITLRINTASMDRHLSMNWIHGHKTIAEVSMSEAQFATMISSIGLGSGTPCTIKSIAGERMPELAAIETKAQMHVREFDDHLAEVYERIDELEGCINDGKMTGKLRSTLSGKLRSIKQAAGSNLKFVASSFSKSMEKTVEDAKIEICSFAKSADVDRPPMLESQSKELGSYE